MKSLAASLALVLLVVSGSLGLVGHLAFRAPRPLPGRYLASEAATRPANAAESSRPIAPVLPTVTPSAAGPPASLPLVTPTPAPSATSTSAREAAGTADTFEAWSALASQPTATALTRGSCDPAYPEERTCIPPGPPFAQGCAITDQRLFSVLPPDPQHLDSDDDGIGCEPI